MNQNELFNYDFSSPSEVLDRCLSIKEALTKAEAAEDVFYLIDAINEWYPGLKKEWIPQMSKKQRELCIRLFNETDNIGKSRKKYFKRKANKGKFDDEELDEFNSTCIEYINECSTIRQWTCWFEDKMNGMFGEDWMYGKNSSQAVKSYSICFTEAKKHFKAYEFVPRPEISIDEFQTNFPEWIEDSVLFKPDDKQAQYKYFCDRAVEKLQETFGRNFTSYDRRYFKSATEAMDLAKLRAAEEFLSDEEIEQMYPQPEKMFETYEECKKDFIDCVLRMCNTTPKVDSSERLNKLIRLCMHYSKYKYYSEDAAHIKDLYDTAYSEGMKVVEQNSQSLPF